MCDAHAVCPPVSPVQARCHINDRILIAAIHTLGADSSVLPCSVLLQMCSELNASASDNMLFDPRTIITRTGLIASALAAHLGRRQLAALTSPNISITNLFDPDDVEAHRYVTWRPYSQHACLVGVDSMMCDWCQLWNDPSGSFHCVLAVCQMLSASSKDR